MPPGRAQPASSTSNLTSSAASGLLNGLTYASSLEAIRARLVSEGIDPSTVQISTIHGGEHANIRALTHKQGCMSFTDTKVDFRTWNEQVYEAWLDSVYSRDVEPWYKVPSSSVFAPYAEGEFGRALIQSYQDNCRKIVRSISNIFEADPHGTLFHKFENVSQEEREDAVLRTFKRPLVAAEKFDISYGRDECPELRVNRITTGRNFYDLCTAIMPRKGSTVPFSLVRSPGGVWERLQDPESGPGHSSMVGLTAGTRVWIEDGVNRRHLFLLWFCLGLLRTIAGASEEDLEIKGVDKVPHLSPDHREAFSTELIPGHHAVPPKHRPDATKPCTNCGQLEKEKKYTRCQRCKEKVNRHHYYCSRECQVDDWKKRHKAICGRPLAETMELGTASAHRRVLDEGRTAFVDQLGRLPRSLFYMPALKGSAFTSWVVPNFVRPFRPTLAKLKAIAVNAFETRDGISVGILSMFVRLATPYSEGGGKMSADEAFGILCSLFDLSRDELEGMEKAAEREIQQREEYELVKSCFEQLETGKPDTSHPDRTIPTSALSFFDMLEVRSTTYYALHIPSDLYTAEDRESPNGGVRGIEFPVDVEPYEKALAAARALAYRVLEGGGEDRLAIGMLQALYTAHWKLTMIKRKPDIPMGYNPYSMVDRLFGDILGHTEKEIAIMRREAMAQLNDLYDTDEWALIVGAIVQLEMQSDWDALDDDTTDDDEDDDEQVQARPSKKKRNKKKKKKAKKAVVAPGVEEGEVLDGVEP
ncbi:hypothetical protein JCM6882_009422 [Rhodosporidiobolus microsporus]